MPAFINTTNREELHSLLLSLSSTAVPLWGKMKPQQMVEHLAEEMNYCNGKKTATCDRPAAKAAESKQHWIYTDAVIPKNLVFVTLPENSIYADLATAINQLMKELADFDAYFKTPGITAVHGAYGPMDHQEWIIWLNKHFSHHFKQFGLIAASCNLLSILLSTL